MGWLLATAFVLSSATVSAQEPLPARDLRLPPALVQNIEPTSFDLIDVREAAIEETKNPREEDPHTHFVVKRHIGASVGYDNTIVHGSVGLYLTVAEWGRWNFGVPSIGVGLGRYPVYDARRQQALMKSQPTVFVSVASVHYRVGYVRSLGLNWYINLEQVYDLRHNMAGSQFGVSLSSK
jgi:hypothetical protein